MIFCTQYDIMYYKIQSYLLAHYGAGLETYRNCVVAHTDYIHKPYNIKRGESRSTALVSNDIDWFNIIPCKSVYSLRQRFF